MSDVPVPSQYRPSLVGRPDFQTRPYPYSRTDRCPTHVRESARPSVTDLGTRRPVWDRVGPDPGGIWCRRLVRSPLGSSVRSVSFGPTCIEWVLFTTSVLTHSSSGGPEGVRGTTNEPGVTSFRRHRCGLGLDNLFPKVVGTSRAVAQAPTPVHFLLTPGVYTTCR